MYHVGVEFAMFGVHPDNCGGLVVHIFDDMYHYTLT